MEKTEIIHELKQAFRYLSDGEINQPIVIIQKILEEDGVDFVNGEMVDKETE